ARARHHRPPAAADGGMCRRRLPGVQVARRGVRAQGVLRPVSGDGGDGRGLDRRADLVAEPRRPRSDQGLRRLQGRERAEGTADDQLEEVAFYRPPEDSPEMRWLKQRLQELGGGLPRRRRKTEPLQTPPLSAFEAQLKSSGERELSTTMAFVRILTTLLRDKN